MLFTDTDVLVYEIETDDVYEDFYENNNLFDFNEHPKISIFFDFVNKKVIVKLKDQVKRTIISEIGGLKSKMHSLLNVNDKEIKIAKLFNKNVVKNISDIKFVNVSFNKNFIRHEMKTVQSKLHKLQLMMFIKFLYLVLMIKDIFLMMLLIIYKYNNAKR